MYTNQWERLSWKIAYSMILVYNTKWVSNQLFGKWELLKLGHLRCRLKIFYLVYKLCSFSRYSSFFIFYNHPMVYQICNVMMSILVHEIRYIFEFIFWTTTHQITKLGQITNICQGNIFPEIFWIILRNRSKLQVLLNLETWSNYSITNYVKIPV